MSSLRSYNSAPRRNTTIAGRGRGVALTGWLIIMTGSADAVTLRLLDNGTGMANKTVSVAPAGSPVTISLRVVVDLEAGESSLHALSGGLQVDAAHSGQYQATGYSYQEPYASNATAGFHRADTPVGVLAPANAVFTGVGLFNPSPTSDEVIGVVEISSVNPVLPGATVTFTLNGKVAVNGVAIEAPPVSSFTLTTAAPSCSAPSVTAANSLKMHGGAGNHGIALGIAPAVGATESRLLGPTWIDVIFSTNIIANDGLLTPGQEVQVSVGSINSLTIVGGNVLRILLTGVPDRSCLHVSLSGIACDAGGSPGPLMSATTLLQRVILGDSNGNARVSSADVNRAWSQIGPANAGNFRSDFNADGLVTAADVNAIKARTHGGPIVCTE